jgi:hypothetical protein
MICRVSGMQSEGDWKAGPNFGQESKVETTPAGAPGTVGPASANGSDIVRSSDPKPMIAQPKLANPGRPPGEILEGTGG